MGKFDINKLIEKNTNDNKEVDYEAINNEINKEVNDLIAKSKPDSEKIKADAVTDLLKELGEADLEGLKSKLKNSSEVDKDKFEKLKAELEENKKALKDYAEKTKNYDELVKEREANLRAGVLKETGISNNAILKALERNAMARMSDELDFKQAIDLELKEDPESYADVPGTTGKPSGNGGGNSGGDKFAELDEIFKELNP